MTVLDHLKESIREVGIKEIARRAGLAASPVSRVNSGQVKPSLEVIEKISAAAGLRLNLQVDRDGSTSPKLIFAKRILSKIKPSAASLLRAEGKILDAFVSQKTDIVSWLHSARGKRIKQRIENDGVRVFWRQRTRPRLLIVEAFGYMERYLDGNSRPRRV